MSAGERLGSWRTAARKRRFMRFLAVARFATAFETTKPTRAGGVVLGRRRTTQYRPRLTAPPRQTRWKSFSRWSRRERSSTKLGVQASATLRAASAKHVAATRTTLTFPKSMHAAAATLLWLIGSLRHKASSVYQPCRLRSTGWVMIYLMEKLSTGGTQNINFLANFSRFLCLWIVLLLSSMRLCGEKK